MYGFEKYDGDTLTIRPSQRLKCYCEDDGGWIVVKSYEADGYKIGFIPTSYAKPIEEVGWWSVLHQESIILILCRTPRRLNTPLHRLP